jgi:methylenetetrahydrofolate reductase (NADPH)
MKITDIINLGKPSLSFEVFPPKTSDSFDSVKKASEEIATLSPSFMSVTYGAGGGTSEYTLEIAKNLQSKGVTALAHLTCVNSTKNEVEMRLKRLKEAGIENILALRGDITPENQNREKWDYHYANQLIAEIKSEYDFCIGGA